MALTTRLKPQLNPTTALTLVGLLSILVLLPLARILWTTVADRGLEVWLQVVASDLSPNLFWTPLFNTLVMGVIVGVGCIVIGGFLAWLVILTDIPGRRLIGLLSSLPFMLPNFALALAWETVMRNERVGGDVGILHSLGVPIPDWLAWGFVPIVLLLTAHYYSLAYSLIAAALTSVNADLIEAGEMTGASRVRVLVGILLPVVLPSMVAAGLLTFAAAVSAFAVPALLGLPVRFYTLSTRLYGMISTGQVERGYVLAVLLIVVAAGLLWIGNRMISGRRAFTTITGKGGRRKRLALRAWRIPAFALALFICLVTTIFPALILLASSFAIKADSFTSGFTAHYWIGESSMEIAQGQAGILRNPQVLDALINTLVMSALVAIAATIFGFAI
ncbi:MAG: ABC transporter permease subunit, partial [Anaerolineales bacterium]|nr:ABC transporter permease subunit [Anaerolineales bacterium]